MIIDTKFGIKLIIALPIFFIDSVVYSIIELTVSSDPGNTLRAKIKVI